MSEAEDLAAELAGFQTRVEELQAARALPEGQQDAALNAALVELEHAAHLLAPRFVELAKQQRVIGSSGQEQRLLRALFQRLPLAAALLDRDAVVRRLNVAATQLFGVRAGYAAGRPLTGSLGQSGRAAFRSQVAAVARGEGDRSLTVPLPHGPSGQLRATLTALHPPGDPQPGVLAVFQPFSDHDPLRPVPPAAGQTQTRAALADVTLSARLMDVLDDAVTALLQAPAAGPEALLRRAAEALQGEFADWVIGDLAEVRGGRMRRVAVCSPEDGAGEPELAGAVAGQDPFDCPLVVEAAQSGNSALQVRPEDVTGFGHDQAGLPLLVSAEVSSLVCMPLRLPSGSVRGVLTLFRTGGHRAFALAEASVTDRISRHVALALHAA